MSITLGDAILHLKADDSELGRGLQAAERDFNNWWGGVQTMAAGAVTGIVAAGVAITRKALIETGEYATQVRQLSSITGDSAERTSRLLQVFADFGIESGQLTMMLRALTSQGLSPQIETIAMLSDRYLALAPGVERATFLQDNFGRSGADLAMVMDQGGAALLTRNATIESGLVLSQAQLDRAEELRQAEDDLNDAWRAATTTLATAVTPALTGFIQQLGNALTPAKELERIWLQINRATADGAATFREYTVEVVDAAIANGNIARSAREYYIQGMLNNSLTALEMETLGASTKAQWEHIQAVNADTAARREDRREIEGVGRAINSLPATHEIAIPFNFSTNLASVLAANPELKYLIAAGLLGGDIGWIYTGATPITPWQTGGAVGGGTGGPPGGWAAWEAAHPGEYWTPGQHGLDFNVEGPSGTDQVPVNLALSRGEHVEVTPAGEGRGPQYPVTFNVYVNNRDDLQALENSVMQIFRGV